MDYNLKPCPFCGEDDLKIFISSIRDHNGKPTKDNNHFVTCRGDCFFAGPSSIVGVDDAVNKWNSRININLCDRDLRQLISISQMIYNFSLEGDYVHDEIRQLKALGETLNTVSTKIELFIKDQEDYGELNNIRNGYC